MIRCGYAYCGAVHEAERCPRCGWPRDPARARDPAFLAAWIDELLPRLPPDLLDLHQVVPRYPGIEAVQRMFEDRLRIRRVLLQSAPDQARSLLGNAELAALAATDPGRYVASRFVDPRAPDALARVEAWADEGVRVLKLLPVLGWRPDDPAFDPLWARMEERGLVAMTHTGFFTARHKEEEAAAGVFASSLLGDPLLWDQPCRRFPRLVVQLCHAGDSLFHEQAARMVTAHEHVWADVAATGLHALDRWLRLGVEVDLRKVFWGNDGPPNTYPASLSLLLATLDRHGATAWLPGLVHDHGARFAERHLG